MDTVRNAAALLRLSRGAATGSAVQRMCVLTNIFPCAKSLGKIFIFNFNALFNYVKRLLRTTTERDVKRGSRTLDSGETRQLQVQKLRCS